MKNTKISVIIPTYNNKKTLDTTIKSCLNQTLVPSEILVCDDGSTDDSKDIVKKINNPKVIWVPNIHTGIPAIPRNNGMMIAKGEWIAFCDSDDEWLPKKLEGQLLEIIKQNSKACSTNAVIKKNNIITNKNLLNWKKENINFKNLLKTNNIICSSAIIHSSIYKKIGGFPEEKKYRGFEDYIYWLRVLTFTNFAFIKEPLVIYDDHPETSIRSNSTSDAELKSLSFNNFILWSKEYENSMFEILNYKYLIQLNLIKQKIIDKIKSIIK